MISQTVISIFRAVDTSSSIDEDMNVTVLINRSIGNTPPTHLSLSNLTNSIETPTPMPTAAITLTL